MTEEDKRRLQGFLPLGHSVREQWAAVLILHLFAGESGRASGSTTLVKLPHPQEASQTSCSEHQLPVWPIQSRVAPLRSVSQMKKMRMRRGLMKATLLLQLLLLESPSNLFHL